MYSEYVRGIADALGFYQIQSAPKQFRLSKAIIWMFCWMCPFVGSFDRRVTRWNLGARSAYNARAIWAPIIFLFSLSYLLYALVVIFPAYLAFETMPPHISSYMVVLLIGTMLGWVFNVYLIHKWFYKKVCHSDLGRLMVMSYKEVSDNAPKSR